MDNDKKTISVHRLPQTSMQDIHRAYGLWIIGTNTGGKTYPDSYASCEERYFEYYSLSHMYDGAGHLWLENGLDTDVKAGDYVLIAPHVVNRYGGFGGKSYIEDSITFKGPVADMLMQSGVITSGVSRLGTLRKLIPVINLARDPARDAQIAANISLQKLLVELYLEKQSSRVEYPLFANLINEIKENIGKWWNVSEMAEMCNLSADQLRRVFIKHTGTCPKTYVDRLKTGRACELLSTTGMKIADIGAVLGYLDQYHFSRRFKSLTGVSPKEYRTAVKNRDLYLEKPLENPE